MNPQHTKFVAILALVAMVSFSIWPFWMWLNAKTVTAERRAAIEALAQKSEHLKAAYKIAMMDGNLSPEEAKEIADAAGEKID